MTRSLWRAGIVVAPLAVLAVASPFACSGTESGAALPPDAAARSDAQRDAHPDADAVADARPEADTSDADAASADDSPLDAPSGDGPVDAPSIIGLAIVTASGAPLHAAAGDALRLQVVYALGDGTTEPLPMGTSVTWTAPVTISAQDPYDASGSVLPEAGAQPTAFFVDNPYRKDRIDYAGTLFVVDPGSGDGGTLVVTAIAGDAGSAMALVTVSPTPAGDPDAGAHLFRVTYDCAQCHGMTGAGSPPSILPDGGVVYYLWGLPFPYPAPGLNAGVSDSGAPHVAADPAWNSALLALAALGDVDNQGVSLRNPMPDWLPDLGLDGGSIGAQDLADIYAFLATQTQ